MTPISNTLQFLVRAAGRPLLATAAIAIAGSVMTGWLFFRWQQADADKLDRIFDERVADRYDQIREAFDQQTERLDHLAGLYRASKSVDADDFREFTLHFLRDPAVKALFWIERQPAPGARDQFPFTCVEPLAPNAPLLGQDTAFPAAWRESLETARDIDAVMSAPGRALAVAGGDGSECFLFLPIYHNGAPHETIADRRANLAGFVGECFQVSRLVDDALKAIPAGAIDTRIYSALSPDSGSLVFNHETRSKIGRDEMRRATRIQLPDTSINGFLLGQRPWSVVCQPTPALVNVVDGSEATWVALNGMLLTAAAAAWTFSNSRRRRTVEHLVEERTAELSSTQKALVAASRQAGMAEVATSVLHNVGNVLNSVNTSVGIASDKVSQLRTATLDRLAMLLQEHAEKLPAFFAENPQGAKLPAFLGQLAGHFTADQQTVLQELASLRKNVEHINEIVAMQQSYAIGGGLTEVLPLGEVIEDALRMNSGALDRHGSRLVREFDPALPPVPVDRNKVVLILVNLIRNAKYACDDGGGPEKCITVRTELNGCARISVKDTGIGIPAENLRRIFEHGFTTRKDGHGFGLHSSALAAQEMGGALRVHSDGVGRGATFTLELPLAPANS